MRKIKTNILDHSFKDIFKGLLGLYVENPLFDLRHGTDTFGKAKNLKSGKNQLPGASGYQPVIKTHFWGIFNLLQPATDCVFLDIGSGKGKVLLLALQYGFRKVIGVEYLPELCEIASSNVAHFKKRYNLTGAVQIINQDIIQYTFTDEQIIFLFNPVGKTLLHKVIENLTRSLQTHPRPVTLIYSNPVHASVLAASSAFTLQKEARFMGIKVVVYQSVC